MGKGKYDRNSGSEASDGGRYRVKDEAYYREKERRKREKAERKERRRREKGEYDDEDDGSEDSENEGRGYVDPHRGLAGGDGYINPTNIVEGSSSSSHRNRSRDRSRNRSKERSKHSEYQSEKRRSGHFGSHNNEHDREQRLESYRSSTPTASSSRSQHTTRSTTRSVYEGESHSVYQQAPAAGTYGGEAGGYVPQQQAPYQSSPPSTMRSVYGEVGGYNQPPHGSPPPPSVYPGAQYPPPESTYGAYPPAPPPVGQAYGSGGYPPVPLSVQQQAEYGGYPPQPPPPQGNYGGYPPAENYPAPGSQQQAGYVQPPVGGGGYPAYDNSTAHIPPGGPPPFEGYPPAPQFAAGGIGGGIAIGGGHNYHPQHHSSAQHHGQFNQADASQTGQYALSNEQLGQNINPANPSAKPPKGPGAKVESALNTFAGALSGSLHGYSRKLFPATSSHKPLSAVGASGESGDPDAITGKRFESFANVRGGNGVKWYVDGKDYMFAVSRAIEQAKESIWIMDWWLSPELYLRRPPSQNGQYRLDRMLQAAAKRGVKIKIIVYKEVTQALTLSSKHTKHALEDTDPTLNIAVMRHPDHLPDRPTVESDIWKKLANPSTYQLGDGLKGLYGMKDGVVLYWAHHEKLCLIDGEVAFMGGLDLCFGRWDMNHHPISDAHPSDPGSIVFPGQDYNNARLMDFHTVDQWEQNKVSRLQYSRMGWSDIALSLIGPATQDLQRHFMERWNFIYSFKYAIRNQPRFQPIDESTLRGGHGYHRRRLKDKVHRAARGIIDGEYEYGGERGYGDDDEGYAAFDEQSGVRCQIVRSCSRWSHGAPITEHSICNAYIEIIASAKHFIYIENQFFITATDNKQNPIINKIGRAIVDRIVRAHLEGTRFRVIIVIPAIPAFAGDLKDDGSLGTRAIMEFQYRSINNDRGYSIYEQLIKAGVQPMDYIRFYNLRSYDRINNSGTMAEAEQKSGVSYEAAAAAHDEKVGGGYGYGGYPHEAVRGDEYERYQKAAPRVGGEWDSVTKCTMLGGGDIRNVPWMGDPEKEIDAFVCEELYVHSKLLIADDRIVICGSANLNDRSQLGDHDSEIAIIIEDPTPLPSSMGGYPHEASHFAATLRRQIFRKHLGLIPAQDLTSMDENMEPVPIPNIYDFDSAEDQLVADPLSDNFWQFWNYTAKTNTEAFRQVFRPVPDDNVHNWKQYDEFFGRYFAVPKGTKEVGGKAEVEWGHAIKSLFSPGAQGAVEVKEVLSRIRGSLVEMPLQFLKEEDIAKEGVGLNVFTETVYT